MHVAHSILFLIAWMIVWERPIKFADEVKLRGVARIPEDRNTNQNDLDILRSCSDKNKINE